MHALYCWSFAYLRARSSRSHATFALSTSSRVVLHFDGHPGWRTDLFLGITQRHSEVMSGSGTLVEHLP